jgi:signal transduction histidine kinase
MDIEPKADIKSPLRILHLEDNKYDRELIATALSDGGLTCHFDYADQKTEFERALESGGLDLVLSDFTLPSFDGMSALGMARRLQPDTPFLFVSGTIGEERAVEGLRSGAVDYVLKDNPARLVPAVVRAVREAQDRVERTKLEAQLRQAQKMEAVGQLAGGVAHDFNNMLAVIRGNVEIVQMNDETLNDEVRQSLNHIVVATERAADLTRQLLAFGRKQVMEARAVNLNDVLGNLAKMLRRVIAENVQFSYASSAPELFITADVGMMEQVLVNLVVNARDAMPEGGSLRIRTDKVRLTETEMHSHSEKRPGEFALLEVMDTGEGIEAENLSRIFEPFFTTKAPGKGTGLGLSMVHGIVKQHKGWIDVITKLNQGTTFRIFLPVAQPTSEEKKS